ncbi:MAG: cell division protein ZapA [Acidiferrobacteraceae bacterium]|nr:cell division protein ZapA [Acidiferrobacteraceae bacterium]
MGGSRKNNVNVSILGRDFTVACPEGQKDQLVEAARFLDKQMREIQGSGKVIGIERCAIMAALNITHEMLSVKSSTALGKDAGKRLRALKKRVDAAVEGQKELAI